MKIIFFGFQVYRSLRTAKVKISSFLRMIFFTGIERLLIKGIHFSFIKDVDRIRNSIHMRVAHTKLSLLLFSFTLCLPVYNGFIDLQTYSKRQRT